MVHPSSTQAIPAPARVPCHVAIIMDGNGRWATRRHLPRTTGHLRGVRAVRRIVEACGRSGVSYLTLFAFSSENWRRPEQEVSLLMRLFVRTLEKEVPKLIQQGVRLRVIGNLAAFDTKLRALIADAERRTAGQAALVLTIAANYGGRWDVLQATRRALKKHPQLADQPDDLDESMITAELALSYAPEPDLFIRTGGEQRISNFLLWQLAYTELYFTPCYWPDFDADALYQAFDWFQGRERRFGQTSAQLQASA